TLKTSLAQLKNGRLMPVDTELRAVWDAMRPSYQGLLAGAITPADAAREMQSQAVEKIAQIHEDSVPDNSVAAINIAGLVIVGALIYWQRGSVMRLVRDWPHNK